MFGVALMAVYFVCGRLSFDFLVLLLLLLVVKITTARVQNGNNKTTTKIPSKRKKRKNLRNTALYGRCRRRQTYE